MNAIKKEALPLAAPAETVTTDRPAEDQRPPRRIEMEGLYAVCIRTNRMEPRYFAGEAVLIDPSAPCKVGDFVVVQVDLGDGKPEAHIGRLIRKTAADVDIEQYNPPQDLSFQAADVVGLYKITLSGKWPH